MWENKNLSLIEYVNQTVTPQTWQEAITKLDHSEECDVVFYLGMSISEHVWLDIPNLSVKNIF